MKKLHNFTTGTAVRLVETRMSDYSGQPFGKPRGVYENIPEGSEGVVIHGHEHSSFVSVRFGSRSTSLYHWRLALVDKAPVKPTAKMTAAVLDLLQTKGTLTSLEAQGVLRCRSLSKRISELKQMGWKISRELKKDTTGQTYARYSLAAA